MFGAVNKTQRVRIRLTGATDETETNNEYTGEYRFSNGRHCIVYTDRTGNAITKVGIEAADNAMLLHRIGYITADMLFDPKTETIVKYEASSLKSGFILHTESYQIICKENCLSIIVAYNLYDDSDEPPITGKQEINISILEENEDEKCI